MSNYRGRFAPSPTGHLHFGSLVTAMASYAQARAMGGAWLLRIEDLDPPREVAGASEALIRDLACFGMHSDEPVVLQSTRSAAYAAALDELKRLGLSFDCGCSRRALVDHKIYPGTCTRSPPTGTSARAIRLRVAGEVTFEDGVQGTIAQVLTSEVGAFVIRRRDGLIAYQLAVVVDDHAQGITEVVRGCDLLDNTPRQIYLQRCLGYRTPHYVHIPVALNHRGRKLSKQTDAEPLDTDRPLAALQVAWAFLGQVKPPSPALRSLRAFWTWAKRSWRLACIPRHAGLRLAAPPGRCRDADGAQDL